MTPEIIALLKCGIDDANDADKVMYVDPSWMRHTCQLALDEIARLYEAIKNCNGEIGCQAYKLLPSALSPEEQKPNGGR